MCLHPYLLRSSYNLFVFTFTLSLWQLFSRKGGSIGSYSQAEKLLIRLASANKWYRPHPIQTDLYLYLFKLRKKMYMFKLKKWICSNWRNVFVQIEDMYLFKLKQTYLFKLEQVYLKKCICLNWKNVLGWIENMYLFELEKCIWLNWKNGKTSHPSGFSHQMVSAAPNSNRFAPQIARNWYKSHFLKYNFFLAVLLFKAV